MCTKIIVDNWSTGHRIPGWLLVVTPADLLRSSAENYRNTVMPTININRDVLFKALGRSYSELLINNYIVTKYSFL